VRAALTAGALDQERYLSYRRLRSGGDDVALADWEDGA
jgi:hypothetical protein